MKLSAGVLMTIIVVILAACHTSASFQLPPNTELRIDEERVVFESKDEAGNPEYVRTPFFWTSIAGIKYELVQDGKVVKQDKLPARFRVVSIFFPPYALIYWPLGFQFKCYDLTDIKKEFVGECLIPEEATNKNSVKPNDAK